MGLIFVGHWLAESSKKVLQISQPTSFTDLHVIESYTNNSNRTMPKQYAFASCSIHSSSEAYCFYTPLIALAWRRLGYEAIIILTGDFTKPNRTNSAVIQLSVEYVHKFGGKVLEFQCPENYSLKISQIIRVFIGFLPLNYINDDDYLIISDSDLVPIRLEQYLKAAGFPDGFIVNRFCCGEFTHRNRTYRMIPMGHLYMKKYLWREMILRSVIHKELMNISTNPDQISTQSYEYNFIKDYSKSDLMSLILDKNKTITFDIISLYLRHEFRAVYDQNMAIGDAAWAMDQRLITVFLFDYTNRTTDGKKVKIYERGLLVC